MLPAADIDRTAQFYADLGFSLRRRTGDEYGILERDGVELHFYAYRDLDPAANSAGCYMRVSDVDALHAEFSARQVERLTPVEDKRWHMREFCIIDPNGNLLRFGQAIATRPAGAPSGSPQ
jgi:catechol 2,3-dioxygenase-like lactoylglutathione lyase family enzyme